MAPLLKKMDKLKKIEPWRGDGGDLNRTLKEIGSQIGGDTGDHFVLQRALFIDIVAFVVPAHMVDGEDPMSLGDVDMTKSILRLKGAHVISAFDASMVTHVVVVGTSPSESMNRFGVPADLAAAMHKADGNIDVVNSEWVHASISQGFVLPVDTHRLPLA